jgi:hypothetical protein
VMTSIRTKQVDCQIDRLLAPPGQDRRRSRSKPGGRPHAAVTTGSAERLARNSSTLAITSGLFARLLALPVSEPNPADTDAAVNEAPPATALANASNFAFRNSATATSNHKTAVTVAQS